MILGNLLEEEGVILHWVAASVMCAIYLYNVPLVFAVCLDARGLRFGVGVFRARIREKKAETREPGAKLLKKVIPFRFVLRMLLNEPPRIEQLDISVTIGTGDAALTAEACGLLLVVISAIRAVTNARGRVRVTPDFANRTLSGEARGIARLAFGHIMKAALLYKLHGTGG
jgi:hypothetical protein